MDASTWPQGLHDIKLGKPMEEVGTNNANTGTLARPISEKKARPPEHLNCPRCNSTNTKFCYYNNYSLTQPRYFCKTCRRYWTEGGSLRNVPVGGGSRKNKRSSSSNLIPDQNPPKINTHFSSIPNPTKAHQAQDLNLVFPVSLSHSYIEESTPDQSSKHQHNFASTSPFSALELLRTGIASRGLNSYVPTPMPDSNTLYSSGFPLEEVKQAPSFNVDGLGSRYGVEENGGRILFPFGEMKQLPNASEADQSKGQGNTTSGGYWNGMLGGGSW